MKLNSFGDLDDDYIFDRNKCVVRRTCRRGSCSENCAVYYKTKYIYSISNVPKKYQDWVPQDLKLIDQEIVESCVSHIKKLLSSDKFCKGLYLYGDVGIGKTALGVTMLNDFLRRMIGQYKIFEYIDNKFTPILFVPFSKFSEDYKSRFSGKSDLVQTIEDNIYKSPLIMIDDIGFTGQTKTTIDLLFNIVDDCISSNRSLVLTGNLRPEQLENVLGTRLYSRISNWCECIEVKASDLRSTT